MNTLAEITANLHAVSFYTWQQYGWHERERELMLFQDDMERDRRTITKVRFTRYAIRITKATLAKYDPARQSWTEHRGESEPVQLANRKGEKALMELIKADCRNLAGAENPAKLFTWSAYYEAEAEKARSWMRGFYATA
jgi:hypothetical protein